jgi:hypothetical protein
MKNTLQVLPPGRCPWFARKGFAFLELVTVMALIGVTLAEGVPLARRLADRMAVVGAREEVMGLFHKVRMEALARGEATILLVVSPPSAQIWSGGLLRVSMDLGEAYGVDLALSMGRDRAELIFDALGLGRVSSQTIRVSRGGAVAILVVSSLGRVTRR